MMWALGIIAEDKIRRAQEEGVFDGLSGCGLPLKLDDDAHVPPELRMAYRMLKNASCLPPELEERKEAAEITSMLADCPDEQTRVKQLQRLNALKMKMRLRDNRSPIMDDCGGYTEKALDRMRSPSSF